MSTKQIVHVRVAERSNRKYWLLVSDTDDCNFLYPVTMLLSECEYEYACAHQSSTDRFEFIREGTKAQDTYRIQVWTEGDWKWGLHDYTKDQAETRAKQLSHVGIKARIRPSSDLFN